MSAPDVIAFPRGEGIGSADVRLTVPVSGQLVPFPSSSGGLTAGDTRTLTELVLALHGEWRCQVERDGCGELWAAMGCRQPAPDQPSAFLSAGSRVGCC